MKQNSAGFTLIELICVLVLIGIIGSGLLIGFTYVVNQQQALRRDYQQVQKSQLAIMRLLSDIKNSSSRTVTSNTISYTYDGAKVISNKNNNLVMTTSDGDHILADNISNLSTSLSNNMVTIQFTTQYSNNISKTSTLKIYVP